MSRFEDAYQVDFSLNPLHTGGQAPDVLEIQRLFRRDPQAAKFVNFDDKTLLHRSLLFHPDRFDLIQLFVESFPGCLLVEDAYGKLPLDVILIEAATVAVVADHHLNSSSNHMVYDINNHNNDHNNMSTLAKQMARTVKYLIEKGPEALVHENAQGQFPLHIACSVSVKDDSLWEMGVVDTVVRGNLVLIQTLIQGFPDALWHPDNHGNFPLHYALQLNSNGQMAPTRVIQLLVDAAPSVLRETIPNAQGQLPLHVAVVSLSPCSDSSTDASESATRTTTTTPPSSSSSSSSSSFLNGSQGDTMVSTIQLLADRFPRALLLQNANDNTPLMEACLRNCSLDVIYNLIRQWPEQVTLSSTLSQAPLVFENLEFNRQLLPLTLVSESVTLDRVQQWVTAQQEQPKQQQQHKVANHHHHDNKSNNQNYNINNNNNNNKSVGILAIPDGTLERLPLHYAAASRSLDLVAMVQYLIQMYPDAVSIQDAKGRLPLHYAALNWKSYCYYDDDDDDDNDDKGVVESTTAAIDLLVQCHPAGLLTTDEDNLLPWHYAACVYATYGSAMVCVVAERLYDQTLSYCNGGDCDVDTYLVPDEVRWDIIQVSSSSS